MKSRRFDLSTNQVVASALATTTAALLASYIGVAGTLIGAAVGSAASTVGTAIYRYYLGRTSDRLRSAARVAMQAGTHQPASSADLGPVVQGPATPYGGSGPTGPGPRGSGGSPPRDGTDQLTGSVSWPREAHFPLGQGRSALGQTRLIAPPPGDRRGEPAASGGRRPHWLVFAGIAAALFALTIGGITVVEALAGRPMSNLVWQKPGSGTSVGNVVRDTSGQQRSPQHSSPATAPAHTPSHTASTPAQTPTPSPSPTVSSPQPSPPTSPPPTGPSPAQNSAAPTG